MENIKINNIEMVRMKGWNKYSINVAFEAYGESHKMSFISHDSQLWDNEDKTDSDLLLYIGGESALLDRI